MFDPAPQAATFTIRVRLSEFWEWFKSLFSPKKGTTPETAHLNPSDPSNDDSASPRGNNSYGKTTSALKTIEMGSPLTTDKSKIFKSDSEEEEPQTVIETTAQNSVFSKLAALVLAIGKFIKNAANAIREHVESSSKQYEASIKAFGKTPMRGI